MEYESTNKKDQTSASPANDIQRIIEEVFNQYIGENYIKASSLPDLDLYVDQITTFLTKHLAKNTRNEDDKIMTKTMINNYTKNHLLPPPEKKKYSRDHVLLMIFIYYFKNFLSISDIQTIIEPLTDQYFHKDTTPNLENIYSTLFEKESILADSIFENVQKEYELSSRMFADMPEEEQAYLKKFAFICSLSLDIYIRKQLIETMIDQPHP